MQFKINVHITVLFTVVFANYCLKISNLKWNILRFLGTFWNKILGCHFCTFTFVFNMTLYIFSNIVYELLMKDLFFYFKPDYSFVKLIRFF